jgi:hypothetical protein
MDIVKLVLGNEVITGVIVAVIVFAAYAIIKATKTKRDDAVLAMIVNAFNRAESIIPDKTGPVWLQKTDAALKVFREQYAAREGKEPTNGLVQFAQDQWALLANELKKPRV